MGCGWGVGGCWGVGWGGGVMLGNQNDRQQWKVFCGLPHICEVAWLVRFHSSLWSSGKHWLSHGVSLSLALSVACSLLLPHLINIPFRDSCTPWFRTIAQAFCIISTTETRWHDCFLQKKTWIRDAKIRQLRRESHNQSLPILQIL